MMIYINGGPYGVQIMRIMRKYRFYIIVLLIFQSCSLPNDNANNQITKGYDNLKENNRYFLESNEVFLYSFDSLWLMDRYEIFDTLCFFKEYDKDLILDAFYTIDSTFSPDFIRPFINDYEKHKFDNIRKLLPEKKHSSLTHIDSIGSNYEIFFTTLKNNAKGQVLLSAPLFDENYQSCLIYFVSLTKINDLGESKINGYFTYYIKVNKEWKYRLSMRAPKRFDFALQHAKE